jgi:4-amino-4-deoxy-L-arabinose transferase-like glycosyltransferase
LLSQVSVVICFWAVWRLASEMVSPARAMLAVLLLECCAFYNFTTPEFNHGICMYASWASAILFFYWALDSGRRRYWAATGVALGLGMLTKYNTATLALPMLAFMVFHPKARRHWRTAGPYLTLMVAAAIFAPHAFWVVNEGFVSVGYLMARTRSDPGWIRQLVNPFEFLFGQCGMLLPVVIAALPITGVPWRLRRLEPGERYRRDFLAAMCLGPVAVYLVISLLVDMKLRTAYGCQLWVTFGLLLLHCLELRSGAEPWRRSVTACIAIAMLLAAGFVGRNLAGPFIQKEPSRVHFPGASLAAAVQQRWHEHFARPLPLAAGEWWLAGNVSYYAPDRPSVYCGGLHTDSLDLIPAYSKWTNDADLNRRGGVILWDIDWHGPELPEPLKKRFPLYRTTPPLTLKWQTAAPVAPLRVGVVIVPPADAPATRTASAGADRPR